MNVMTVRYEKMVASSSYNVKAYVRAARRLHALVKAAELVNIERVTARGKLTGSQWAEARRILEAEDLV
jgi:hypothetical protein